MDGVLAIEDRPGPQSRWFEDFRVGETFVLPTRTLTASLFRAFTDASGEAHPLHTDSEYCRAQGLPDMLAHGFLVTIQTAAGAGLFPYLVEESLVGLLDQSSRFARPVHAGDELFPVLQVTELAPNNSTGVLGMRSTVHNQRRELVLEGTQRWLLRKKPVE